MRRDAQPAAPGAAHLLSLPWLERGLCHLRRAPCAGTDLVILILEARPALLHTGLAVALLHWCSEEERQGLLRSSAGCECLQPASPPPRRHWPQVLLPGPLEHPGVIPLSPGLVPGHPFSWGPRTERPPPMPPAGRGLYEWAGPGWEGVSCLGPSH